jgi:hypothetical protein
MRGIWQEGRLTQRSRGSAVTPRMTASRPCVRVPPLLPHMFGTRRAPAGDARRQDWLTRRRALVGRADLVTSAVVVARNEPEVTDRLVNPLRRLSAVTHVWTRITFSNPSCERIDEAKSMPMIPSNVQPRRQSWVDLILADERVFAEPW